MNNPLKQLETAAKGAVQNTVSWAFNDRPRSIQSGKTDPIFGKQPMDVLRRAAYHNVFDTLFLQQDDFPYVTPDKTLRKVIGKLANNVFPKGTTFSLASDDGRMNELLAEMIRQTRFQLKTETIVKESALMGYCGIRTVWSDHVGGWIYEIKPKEYLVIETLDGIPEEITAIGMEWPVEVMEGKRKIIYWKKERWTPELYEVWTPKKQTAMGKPSFAQDAPIASEPNVYGEIPITIVPHIYNADAHGVGVVGEDEILTVKSLIRLHHKRHFGHLKFMDPNPVVKNRTNPGQPIDFGLGKVIDIAAADERMPVDLALLEFSGIPESAQDEMYDHIMALYDAADLKAPAKDQVFKPGTGVAGVALRLLDKDDAETIDTLRDNGYSQVLRHFEKMLRMGARMRLPEYSGINPEDPESWTVLAAFPDFFPPTDQDITAKISNMKLAHLPPTFMAQEIAGLFGIEDEALIEQIADSLEQDREARQSMALDLEDDEGE